MFARVRREVDIFPDYFLVISRNQTYLRNDR
jgi:hypothetical protein